MPEEEKQEIKEVQEEKPKSVRKVKQEKIQVSGVRIRFGKKVAVFKTKNGYEELPV